MYLHPTKSLIFLNVAIYLAIAIATGHIETIPSKTLLRYGGSYGPLTVLFNEWWRLFSAMFLHGGLTHLLMNMFSLYLVGRGLERFVSQSTYFLLYFASGIIGSMVSLYFHPMSVAIGASGAIFGVFGALSGIILSQKEKFRHYGRLYLKDFAIVIAVNLLIGLLIPSIDLSAHIAGLTVGLIGGLLIGRYHTKGTAIFIVLGATCWVWMATLLEQHYAELFY